MIICCVNLQTFTYILAEIDKMYQDYLGADVDPVNHVYIQFAQCGVIPLLESRSRGQVLLDPPITTRTLQERYLIKKNNKKI